MSSPKLQVWEIMMCFSVTGMSPTALQWFFLIFFVDGKWVVSALALADFERSSSLIWMRRAAHSCDSEPGVKNRSPPFADLVPWVSLWAPWVFHVYVHRNWRRNHHFTSKFHNGGSHINVRPGICPHDCWNLQAWWSWLRPMFVAWSTLQMVQAWTRILLSQPWPQSCLGYVIWQKYLHSNGPLISPFIKAQSRFFGGKITWTPRFLNLESSKISITEPAVSPGPPTGPAWLSIRRPQRQRRSSSAERLPDLSGCNHRISGKNLELPQLRTEIPWFSALTDFLPTDEPNGKRKSGDFPYEKWWFSIVMLMEMILYIWWNSQYMMESHNPATFQSPPTSYVYIPSVCPGPPGLQLSSSKISWDATYVYPGFFTYPLVI